MVSVYAVKGFDGVSKPVDNPLQIPAHRYSEKVLASGKESVRTTPKFERGRLLGNVMFVSGTAAIRGKAAISPRILWRRLTGRLMSWRV